MKCKYCNREMEEVEGYSQVLKHFTCPYFRCEGHGRIETEKQKTLSGIGD